MRVLIVTEIWGYTAAVGQMADAIRADGHTVGVVDPYDGTDPVFSSEDEAYSRFLSRCGPDGYARRVTSALLGVAEAACLVGFSAGAGAVWAALCGADVGAARFGIGFYGSAIRTMADRRPKVPVELVFPAREPHFDVAGLVGLLRMTPEVRCHVVSDGHGFMNPLSANYREKAQAHWLAWLRERINSLDGKESR